MTLAIVTGAPGWLGTRIVKSLVEGVVDVPALGPSTRRVRCLVHDAGVTPGVDELQALGPQVEIVRGDLTRRASLDPLFAGAKGATVFHAAGIIHPTKGVSELTAVNVDGTTNMVEAAKAAGVRRFVHVSSNSPIGTNPTKDHVFDESAPYNPYMMYGRTKMKGEEVVRRAHAAGDLETVVIRPPWFYGPGQPARQTLFFEMIRDGKAPLVGDGENRRSMAYVDNICQGLLLCEQVERAAGQVYWIADRRPYPMKEILDTIERVMEADFGVKCKHRRMKLPGVASEVAWVIDAAMQGAGLYHPKIHVLSEMNKTIACSVAKAEAELGYDPKVDLAEGMRRSIQWMLDRGEKL
jgi:nucleoside-diphosphate-sugar epimerase